MLELCFKKKAVLYVNLICLHHIQLCIEVCGIHVLITAIGFKPVRQLWFC